MLFLDPMCWTHDNIRTWLHWIQKKFQISQYLDPDVFPNAGHHLCSMSEQDFTSLTGNSSSGTILFRHISCMREAWTGVILPPLPSAFTPPPSYQLPSRRTKRLSSSSTCSTTSLAPLSVQSAPASLSSSSKSAEKISGKFKSIILRNVLYYRSDELD